MDEPTRLSTDGYLAAIVRESARFRDVLASASPTAQVPTCPDWSTDDLLWHLAEVQWFWSEVVARRPAGPDSFDPPPRPGPRDALLAAFDEWSAQLVDRLTQASPREAAWSWSEDRTVGFTHRRQAHEALVHRVDAELAAGVESAAIDPALAADGVHEALTLMLGGVPSWAAFDPDGTHVAVDCTDTGDRLLFALGRVTGTSPSSGRSIDEPTLSSIAGSVPADARLAGPAAAVDLWLWRRADDEPLEWSGDDAVIGALRSLREPIT